MTDEALRLLVVDDLAEDREAIRRMLSAYERPIQASEAGTGEEALALCRREPFDCILLDYHLPDMNGVELLAELADQGSIADLPVVMITGQGNETVAVEAMKQGAQDYLVKGQLTAAALTRAIDNTVEKMGLRREIADLRHELRRLSQISDRIG